MYPPTPELCIWFPWFSSSYSSCHFIHHTMWLDILLCHWCAEEGFSAFHWAICVTPDCPEFMHSGIPLFSLLESICHGYGFVTLKKENSIGNSHNRVWIWPLLYLWRNKEKKQRNKYSFILVQISLLKKTHYIHILGNNIAVLIYLSFLNRGGDVKITINLIQEDPEISWKQVSWQ